MIQFSVMVATNPTFIQRDFWWDERRTKAALMLAQGESKVKTAQECEIDRVTLYHWLEHPDFAAEVDRLSLMVNISSRAERLRAAMRVLRSMMNEDEVLRTEKDALDWLKFAQSETDGAKIDLSKLAEMLAGETQQDGANGSSGNNRLLDQASSDSSSSGKIIEVTAQASPSPEPESAMLTSEHSPPQPTDTDIDINPS